MANRVPVVVVIVKCSKLGSRSNVTAPPGRINVSGDFTPKPHRTFIPCPLLHLTLIFLPTAMEITSQSKGRRYGFACLVCRRRKVKCDGRWPTCVNCARSRETCLYKGNDSNAKHLAVGLRSEKARVQELHKHIRELATMDSDARDRRLADLVSQLDLNGPEPDDMTRATTLTSPSRFSEDKLHDIANDVSYDGGAQFSIDKEGRVSILADLYFKQRRSSETQNSNITLGLPLDFIQFQRMTISSRPVSKAMSLRRRK